MTDQQAKEYEESYQRFVESMIQHCHCDPQYQPCESVLCGGVCDNRHDVEIEDDREIDGYDDNYGGL